MELRTYAKILMRRWWLIAIPVAVVLVYVAATYAPPPTPYRVVMRFSAGTEPAGLSLDYDRYYPWLTSEYIANGLADVAETGTFARAAAERLGAMGEEVSPAALQGAIVTDNAQSILVVYLTWSDPDQIVAVANAVTEELTENSAAYYPQLENLEPAVRLLDEPVPVPMPPGLRAQLTGPAVRLALAVFVGVGLAFLWHYLDPTVHEAEALEDMGLDVLARIPRK
jgi:capsular polysaccharide biosynthesis protein